jgi:hypothetical protein
MNSMLWTISLFNLKPGVSPDPFCQHLANGLPDYERDLRGRGQRFLGLYRVELELTPGTGNLAIALTGTWAEVCLVEGRTVSESALGEVQVARPVGIQDWLNARMRWIAPEGLARLWLQPLGLSPWAAQPLLLKDRLLHLTLRHLPAGKTIQELAEFDERIIAPYAEYMTQAHWFHIGTYHIFGLPEYMYVDTLDVVQADSRGEALANDAAVPVTPEMQAIYDECSLFLDQTRERYQLWLSPILLGQAAQAGMRLGGAG